MGLLKFLMITIFVLWLIRIILKLVFPMILRNIFGKMQQQANNGGAAPQPKKPEGSISIDYMPPQQKPGNADKLGDFVDYEELK
ncbi:hypothetical protein AAKU52_000613 [Pedobacter sp. CG_S7]|uniref:DUF4834 domain-containing protein n=1 Tax=Pedobacter sp. CG_S7 TaxID=3143930 RepID=UPI0033964CDB